VCVRGASALNRLLAEFPGAPLHVQVVWEPVLKTDLAPPLTGVLNLIDDPRVVQYWDPRRVVSAELVRAVNQRPDRFGFDEPLPPEFVVWDVVALYDRSARWDGDVPVPIHYGGPVLNAIDQTREELSEQLK
jgi:hypothetical protein